MRIFSGNANRPLAEAIAAAIGCRLGELTVGRFPDGEVKVQIMEDVRGADTFIIQPTTSNDFLMELLIIADCLRRASAKRITAVIPYFGYARQDRKHEGRVPITAKLVANLITTAGIDRVLTVDLHAEQIQGFFDIPVDHLSARPVILEYLRSLKLEDPVVASPDTGSIKLAERLAKALGARLAIIHKRRLSDNTTEVAHVIGEIGPRPCIICDDMITTAGSMVNAVNTARQFGATRVIPVATHGVLCGDAFDRLYAARLDELVITDTIPLKRRFADLPIRVLTLAPLLGEAVKRIHTNQSVSALFSDSKKV
ncbi:MAG: ribose-phosphate pyrophosphokinase [Planctomycetota bacterium]|nr:ribose-phosphate pyrophosphokinase [Planctomycetota bacterium]MCX8039735.1 ribose-phosphate pyrophosphokinase [Planctomycetota bacterium]MDW8373239.1 ribose-phosphate pyrophosphokinase [Planctomycetota bacterium]